MLKLNARTHTHTRASTRVSDMLALNYDIIIILYYILFNLLSAEGNE